MLGPIPFEIPAKYTGDIVSGTLIRAGALLKDTSSGQIVAHLQETGLAQKLISSTVSSPFSPLQVLSAPSSLAANIQLVQLKAMVEGLQILQFVNLGATMAGIGVSAMGFALMNKKLNGLQSQMVTFASRVEVRFQELHERELRTHYSRIHGLFNQADQAHSLTASAAEWQRIAGVLADESAYFRGEVAHLIQSEIFDNELFGVLARSYALCNAGRIECLALARELQAAHKVSLDVAGDYNALFDPLTPIQLAHKSASLIENKDMPFDHLLKQELVGMRSLVNNLREVQDAATSKPYLMETLIERGIDGYEYVQAIRNEKEQPLLLIEAS